MAGNILLVVANSADEKAVRHMLVNAPDGPFTVERLSRCADACNRLRSERGERIAAVMLDLWRPDSQGIGTFDALFRASSDVPILVIGHSWDEDAARLAVQRGAQDYLLEERLDGYSLPKALSNMLRRSVYGRFVLGDSERARATLAAIGDAVISTDLAGNVAYLNAVAEGMTGWSLKEACGRRLEDVLQIIDADTRRPVVNPASTAIRHNKKVGLAANCLLIRRDGYESAIEDSTAPIHGRHGQVTGAVIVFHDVGASRAMSLRMAYLAQHDVVTELPNRLLLNDRLTQAIAAAHRHSSALAVLFLDVDRFKLINDSMGHATGDRLLKSIAKRLVQSVRTSDTVSRQGGDEFVILLSEVTHARDAAIAADKILAAVSMPYRINHQTLRVTVSVGIGVYPADGTDAQTLLKNADLALLRAKGRGRNNHQFFVPAESRRVG